MDNIGPYETERDAYAALMPRAVVDAQAAAALAPHLQDRASMLARARATKMAAVYTTLAEVGVGLGDYDRRIIDWLAGWEPSTVQVIIGLIRRVHEAGFQAGAEFNAPPD